MNSNNDGIQCPACDELIASVSDDQQLHCQICNTNTLLVGHLCPECLSFHEEFQEQCRQCETRLIVNCPHCQQNNWSGAEVCRVCAGSLSIVDLITERYVAYPARGLERQKRKIRDLKELEAEASRSRMNQLLEIEERRLSFEKERDTRKNKRERRMLILVFSAVGLFLMALLLYALLNALT